MRSRTAILPAASRPHLGLTVICLCGCALAIAAGAAAATDHGALIVGAIFGSIVCAAAVALFLRDPVLAFIWLWIFVVFSTPLSTAIGYYSSASTGAAVRQANEIFVLLFVVLTAWRAVRVGVRTPPLRFILPGIGVAACGLLSAVVHGVPLTVTVLGLWLGLKLWIMVVVTLLLPWMQRDVLRLYTVLTRVGMFLAAVGFVDYLTHGAISNALHTSNYEVGLVFRGEAAHSIFPVPGEYSLFMSLLFAITFARFATTRNKADLAYALLFAGSVMLSLRLKGFLSIGAVITIIALIQAIANNRGSLTILLAGVLLLIGIYSVEGNVIAKQFSTYTSSETSVRARLYKVGSQIASDDFPLGAGLGRFGGSTSRLYYSPIYSQYDLSSIYGLSRTFPIFIDDTSWPSVMGETGYIGFVIYLVGIIVLVLAVIRKFGKATIEMKWVPLAALCVITVLLVTSIGQGTLFDWLAITTVALMLGPALTVTGPSSEQFSTSRP